jgi:hypothetical protein
MMRRPIQPRTTKTLVNAAEPWVVPHFEIPTKNTARVNNTARANSGWRLGGYPYMLDGKQKGVDVQARDISGGVDREIIRIVLRDPDILSHKLVSALREKGLETDRSHVREIRRIARLVMEESTRGVGEAVNA